ncbi:MAG TPA: CBS domain-containing protein [Candidatus Acidoferrales bacterium]|nr:CBS domain-containing protein [Candidatus Acidoferrales bacterium]
MLTARDVMNPIVLSVREDKTVQELATFLTENEISGAPVVDARGKLVGVVSLRDIVERAAETSEMVSGQLTANFYAPGRAEKLTPNELSQMHIENEGLLVREIMTPTVYTVKEDTPVSEVAGIMISGHIHRLLVTRAGQAVGIVTTLDLLKLLVKD